MKILGIILLTLLSTQAFSKDLNNSKAKRSQEVAMTENLNKRSLENLSSAYKLTIKDYNPKNASNFLKIGLYGQILIDDKIENKNSLVIDMNKDMNSNYYLNIYTTYLLEIIRNKPILVGEWQEVTLFNVSGKEKINLSLLLEKVK